MKKDIQCFPKLVAALKQHELVYLFGAGFSTALTGRKYTWGDWIADGIARIQNRAIADQLADDLHADQSANNMAFVVGKVIETLKAEQTYDVWMQAAFETTEIVNDELRETLKKTQITQDVLATTNYDSLLEAATGLAALSYQEPNVAFKMLEQHLATHILHIHGIYDSQNGIDDIVADEKQYESVMKNQGAQFIQGILGTRTLIFVGCGKTTEDANISRFIQFANQHLKMNREYYFLCREGEELKLSIIVQYLNTLNSKTVC